jgi:zona occludens toxin
MLIKCRKADILGRKDSYIRKVHGGYRGAVISTEERKYESQYFKLYKSHTQGNSVAEVGATDVAPFIVKFRRFMFGVFALFLVCIPLFIWYARQHPVIKAPVAKGRPVPVGARVVTPASIADAEAAERLARTLATARTAPLPAPAASSADRVVTDPSENWPDPLASKGVHLLGRIRGEAKGGRVLAEYLVAISENASYQVSMSTTDLKAMGFKYHALTDCAGMLEWHGKVRAVICDSPQFSPGVGSGPNSRTQPEASTQGPTLVSISGGGAKLPPVADSAAEGSPAPSPRRAASSSR